MQKNQSGWKGEAICRYLWIWRFCLLEQVILNLLPSGIYERYVKFYLGLLLLILLLQPVLQIFHLTGQLDSRVFTSAYEWEEQAEIWKTEWKLSEDWQER